MAPWSWRKAHRAQAHTRPRILRPCAVAAAGVSAVLGVGCTESRCENEVIRGLPAPDGAAIAFVFRRNCASPPGRSTHVSVIDMQRSLRSGPGNVLVVAGDQAVTVSWLGPKTLAVGGFKEPVILRNPHVDLVTIEFHLQPVAAYPSL